MTLTTEPALIPHRSDFVFEATNFPSPSGLLKRSRSSGEEIDINLTDRPIPSNGELRLFAIASTVFPRKHVQAVVFFCRGTWQRHLSPPVQRNSIGDRPYSTRSSLLFRWQAELTEIYPFSGSNLPCDQMARDSGACVFYEQSKTVGPIDLLFFQENEQISSNHSEVSGFGGLRTASCPVDGYKGSAKTKKRSHRGSPSCPRRPVIRFVWHALLVMSADVKVCAFDRWDVSLSKVNEDMGISHRPVLHVLCNSASNVERPTHILRDCIVVGWRHALCDHWDNGAIDIHLQGDLRAAIIRVGKESGDVINVQRSRLNQRPGLYRRYAEVDHAPSSNRSSNAEQSGGCLESVGSRGAGRRIFGTCGRQRQAYDLCAYSSHARQSEQENDQLLHAQKGITVSSSIGDLNGTVRIKMLYAQQRARNVVQAEVASIQRHDIRRAFRCIPHRLCQNLRKCIFVEIGIALKDICWKGAGSVSVLRREPSIEVVALHGFGALCEFLRFCVFNMNDDDVFGHAKQRSTSFGFEHEKHLNLRGILQRFTDGLGAIVRDVIPFSYDLRECGRRNHVVTGHAANDVHESLLPIRGTKLAKGIETAEYLLSAPVCHLVQQLQMLLEHVEVVRQPDHLIVTFNIFHGRSQTEKAYVAFEDSFGQSIPFMNEEIVHSIAGFDCWACKSDSTSYPFPSGKQFEHRREMLICQIQKAGSEHGFPISSIDRFRKIVRGEVAQLYGFLDCFQHRLGDHANEITTPIFKFRLTFTRVGRRVLIKGLAARRGTHNSVPTHAACGSLLQTRDAHTGAVPQSRETGGWNRRPVMRLSLSARTAPSNPLAGVSGALHNRSNAMVSESMREGASALSLVVNLPKPVPGDPYTYIASGPNAAIAIAAAMESVDESRITDLMSSFAVSAEYKLLKNCFRDDQRRIHTEDPVDAAEREEFILDLVLSRMFLAGVRFAALPQEVRNAA